MTVHTVRLPRVRRSVAKPHDSMKTMRMYIADGMGMEPEDLPGLEASVLSLAVEAKLQRKLAEDRLVLIERARPKLPIGTMIYVDICEALRVARRPVKKSKRRP